MSTGSSLSKKKTGDKKVSIYISHEYLKSLSQENESLMQQCENEPLMQQCENISPAKESSIHIKSNRNDRLFRRLDSGGSLSTFKIAGKQGVVISGRDIKNVQKRDWSKNVALPTKFLLGGNRSDPLNLKSFENEDTNRKLNAFTPSTSPVPVSIQRTQVQILIPTNIYDPLNLNTGEDIEFAVSSKNKKRKRHRRICNRKEDFSDISELAVLDEGINESDYSLEETLIEKQIEIKEEVHVDNFIAAETASSIEQEIDGRPIKERDDSLPENHPIPHVDKSEVEICEEETSPPCDIPPEAKAPLDKIVSPAVPQGSKFFKRSLSQPTSAEKSFKNQRRSRKKRIFDDVSFNKKNCRYLYGSIPSCCHCSEGEDVRFTFLENLSFYRKEVLDIGCNMGCISAHIAEHYEPKRIVAIDIDSCVVKKAQTHLLQHFSFSNMKKEEFPISLSHSLGPLYRHLMPSSSNTQILEFPQNVTFFEENYVLNSDEALELQQPEFDVILAMRVTKWIHLNWGDEGLKRSFKRMFCQLRFGGQLILQPQPWKTYAKSKKLNNTIYENYNSIKLKPGEFIDYLLSKEVGFSSCKVLGRIPNKKRGYTQSLYVLTKASNFSPKDDAGLDDTLSPVVFNDIQWARSYDEEADCAFDWGNSIKSTPSSDVLPLPEDINTSQFNLNAENEVFFDGSYLFPPDFDSDHDLYKEEG